MSMMERLPYYYRKSEVVKELYRVIQLLLDKLSAGAAAEEMRLFITTTDDFTLHEKDVRLSEIVADNETKRSRVLAKLQGYNLLTKEELERYIKIYDKTGCTVTEDFANYTINIVFSGRTGVPYNIDEIKAAVDEVKPAHIKVEYGYIKNTWNDIHRKLGLWKNGVGFTWNSAAYYDGRTWLYVDSNENVFLREDGANAYVVFVDGEPYARLL